MKIRQAVIVSRLLTAQSENRLLSEGVNRFDDGKDCVKSLEITMGTIITNIILLFSVYEPLVLCNGMRDLASKSNIYEGQKSQNNMMMLRNVTCYFSEVSRRRSLVSRQNV